MGVTECDVEKAGLLHDIGKLIQRAEKIHTKNHAAIGEAFLRKYDLGKEEPIFQAVANHHYKELQKANLPADDISYIVYEADNLASAADRRPSAEGTWDPSGKKLDFKADMPLHSLFNIFEGNGTDTAYPVRQFGQPEQYTYPVDKERIIAPAEEYQKLEQALKDAFATKNPFEMSLSELLQVMESTCTYIPSSTNGAEIPDISLYDHQKLTAAFAVCIWHYFQESHITDYKKRCFGKQNASMREEPIYRLVSGDLSGIQKFIYTIPSKGALKSLRGRSLYLDLLTENIVDEILKACQVSRSCLLYSGGGHFYLLLPNSEKVRMVLDVFQEQLQDWFLKHFGTALYMALASVPCSAMDFMQGGKGAGAVFHKVSRALKHEKLDRYTEKQLKELFTPGSRYNQLEDGERECGICHSSTAKLQPYGDIENLDETTEACETCNGLFHLGKEALDKSLFYVGKDPLPYAVPMPGFGRELYLLAIGEQEMGRYPDAVRIYTKNQLALRYPQAVPVWMGDHTYRNPAGLPVEFSELAKQSGGEGTGIERIGILRAGVDNLGAAFLCGLPKKYDTLSRKAVLSRLLSFFFKRGINGICSGNLPKGCTPFTLFQGENKKERKIHIIYSGGDDMFLAGSWDDILEVAVDLRHAFQIYTNEKLTFSAGIGFFKPSFPISQMAQKTEALESYAKNLPGKNGVALFGEVTQYKANGEKEETVRYTWDDFEKGVCGEKLPFLQKHFELQDNPKSPLLFAGKGRLYRMLELMREAKDNHLNLARFAYVLARMEPKKDQRLKQETYRQVRNQLYQWYQSDVDRQQLITAIELLVYYSRDKGVE